MEGMGCGGLDVVMDVGWIRVVSLDGGKLMGRTDWMSPDGPPFFLRCRGVAGAGELLEAFLIRHRPFCSHLPSFALVDAGCWMRAS